MIKLHSLLKDLTRRVNFSLKWLWQGWCVTSRFRQSIQWGIFSFGVNKKESFLFIFEYEHSLSGLFLALYRTNNCLSFGLEKNTLEKLFFLFFYLVNKKELICSHWVLLCWFTDELRSLSGKGETAVWAGWLREQTGRPMDTENDWWHH